MDVKDRVENAMKEAEANHYIPRLMDPEDLLSGIDTISTLTLIATIKNEVFNAL